MTADPAVMATRLGKLDAAALMLAEAWLKHLVDDEFCDLMDDLTEERLPNIDLDDEGNEEKFFSMYDQLETRVVKRACAAIITLVTGRGGDRVTELLRKSQEPQTTSF